MKLQTACQSIPTRNRAAERFEVPTRFVSGREADASHAPIQRHQAILDC